MARPIPTNQPIRKGPITIAPWGITRTSTRITTMTIRTTTGMITPPATGFTEPGTYRFVNRGEEAHEVVFVRLKDGRTLADAATYQLGGPGEAPFTFEAGPAGMAPGSEVYVDLDLRPGSWIALCMIPGEHTGQPNADMGMLLPFEVPA